MAPTSGTLDIAHALKGERVAFTGRLASVSRRQAQEIVRQRGGQCTTVVNRFTTLLVVGMKGWPLLGDGQLSNKLQKAEALRKSSEPKRLRVFSEEQFLEMAGLKAAESCVDKPMDAAQVCDLISLAPDTLQRWELLGLVRSTNGRFDFQDLVSLKTIAALVAQGASTQTISQSVRALARIVPGTDRPLAQLKLLTDQDTLVAEVNGALVAPGGQLVMRFEPEDGDDDPDAGPMMLTQVHREPSGDEWFDIACAHEEAGELESAASAYRRALQLEPHSAPGHFNLANVLRAMGRREAAEERYRVAIEHDRAMAEAWFNLADMLDDSGRCEEALQCLRTAIECAPHFADAHYNLAVCCERAGLLAEAKDHWTEYVRLDPASEWATFARRRVEA